MGQALGLNDPVTGFHFSTRPLAGASSASTSTSVTLSSSKSSSCLARAWFMSGSVHCQMKIRLIIAIELVTYDSCNGRQIGQNAQPAALFNFHYTLR